MVEDLNPPAVAAGEFAGRLRIAAHLIRIEACALILS
jgi:hypothetical protein